METKRRSFQGVLNILDFNRHFYYIGVGILAALIISRYFINWPDTVFWIIIGGFIYGLLMPLIVSAYVYDFSGYYDLHWLKPQIAHPERLQTIVNIHAGFDETSFLLHERYPQAELKVFDFYNKKDHTEPAIVRARRVSMTWPGTQTISSTHIPVADHSVDIVFLLSAVHEIRVFEEKVRFLKECHRIVKLNGQVIMVEHLRDFPNFVAFTVGFTHFFSRDIWKKAFREAGFSEFDETKFTAFMSVFNCRK